MKNNNNLTYLGVGAILVAGVIAFFAFAGGSGDNNMPMSSGGMGMLVAQEENFNFGTIAMSGGNVSHMFEVQNESEEPIRIKKVYTSCMCTEAYIITAHGEKYGAFGMPGHTSSVADIEIMPGETMQVEAVFDPAAHGPSGVGLAQRVVYVETNSSQTPKLELTFQAIVAQ